MNDANIDHLMQITLPRASWPAPALGSRDEGPAFDEHLAQASTPRAPVEPARAPEDHTSEGTPPGCKLPAQGESTRPLAEDSGTAAAPPSTDKDAKDDNSQPAESNGDAPAAAHAQDETAVAD